MFKTLAALAVAASLVACAAPPTPYQFLGLGGNRFGLLAIKLTDHVSRIRFIGTARTPRRWIDAFLLYYSAQHADGMGAPAFTIVNGDIDVTVLDDDDIYGQGQPDARRIADRADRSDRSDRVYRPGAAGDSVVGHRALAGGLRPTAAVAPAPRAAPWPSPASRPMPMPMPLPLPLPLPSSRSWIIAVPDAAVTPADRSILVEWRSDLKDVNKNTFVTADVLARLGPRIRRAASDAPFTVE